MSLAQIEVESIFLPTDFSEASAAAFYHALKIALVAKANLNVLHVADTDTPVDWQSFPQVRETLTRWNVLPAASARSDVGRLGIGVTKAAIKAGNVVKAALHFLQEHPADLIVLATRHEGGKARWFSGSIGEPIARNAGEMTLFLPNNCRGFVDGTTGAVSLSSILIPVAEKPPAQPSVFAALKIINALNLPTGHVECLHVGTKKPDLPMPEDSKWKWDYTQVDGSPVAAILDRAAAMPADLIIMTTDGPDGFLDGLRGTTAERVLAQAQTPVLILPHTAYDY